MPNVITLMLFLILYQQITLSPHCDTSLRVSIIPVRMYVPGENGISVLRQLATGACQGGLIPSHLWNVEPVNV